MVPDLALAWWSVLTKQKAVNFGGVEVQILTTSCAFPKTILLCTTNPKLISRSFTLIKDSYKKTLIYKNIRKTHHVAPSSVSLPKLSPFLPSSNIQNANICHSDLVMCRKQAGIAIGRLCDKCDGKCPVCDSYVRPTTLVRICDECSFGNYQNKCVVCGGEVRLI
jgi:hypothetical protein